MPIARARAAKPFAGDQLFPVGEFGVLVVLTDIDQGQVPEHGDVGGFIPDALVDGAVAEEGHTHLTFALPLDRKSAAGGDPQPAADDAVGAQDAQADIRDVHLAAFAAAITGHLAHHFCHHRVHLPALGDDVPVAAVGAGDGVIRAQRRAHTHRGGFLPVRQVRQTGHPALAVDSRRWSLRRTGWSSSSGTAHAGLVRGQRELCCDLGS